MGSTGGKREVDCPLCEGYGTMRDYLSPNGRPSDCWLCEGWGKVALPSEADPLHKCEAGD